LPLLDTGGGWGGRLEEWELFCRCGLEKYCGK